VAINPKHLNEGEHVVISTRTHPKVLIFPLLVLAVTLAAAAYVSTLGDGDAAKYLHYAVWALAAVVIIWYVVRPVIVWAFTTYTFTNRRFIKRSGFIAKEGRTIPLNRVSEVDFEIGVIDRIFGCGTLVVSDASEQGRVELADIPRVEQVQLKVSEELHKISGARGQSDDGT
jgi:uncharacterized membrane protein YdbT with pleckstrin-like domain